MSNKKDNGLNALDEVIVVGMGMIVALVLFVGLWVAIGFWAGLLVGGAVFVATMFFSEGERQQRANRRR